MDGAHDEVSEIRVSNSQFIRTMSGARIKTWQGGSGFARDISFQQLTVTGVGRPIVIDQYYCNGGHGCSNKTSAVKVSNVEFVGIHGSTTEEVPISLACSQTVGCTGITLGNVRLSSANGKRLTSYTLNAHGKTTPPVVPRIHLLS
ncbi:hypothetical protein ACLOJK_040358 [Asimina triloba]